MRSHAETLKRGTLVRVQINGKERQLDAETTVATLLLDLEVAPERVAVEVNRELVTRSKFEETVLNEGDTIEIVTFVGGG
ncbi:MAG: sulfur carrier protein ThiS [Planctomycetota bacterium]